MHGPVEEQGIWKTRNNQELRKLYKDLCIVADINKKLLEWIGHVVRRDQGRTVKVYENKPEQSRRGRPRQRRPEDVEKDLWQMKVQTW
jgi:hypothetical protein